MRVRTAIMVFCLCLLPSASSIAQTRNQKMPDCGTNGFPVQDSDHVWFCKPQMQAMPVKMHEPTICDRDSDCVGNLRCDFAMTPRLPGAGFCLPPRHPNAEPKVSSAAQPTCEPGLHPVQDPNGNWICWAN